MADYMVQLKDEKGNRQYPVTITDAVVNAEGVTLTEILANSGGTPAPTTKSDFNSSFSKDF